jgi:hypothetical protein
MKDGLVVIAAKGDMSLTHWLSWAIHIDTLEVTLWPLVRQEELPLKFVAQPVVTNLKVREFGESKTATRLNQLLALLITAKSQRENELEDLSITINFKEGVNAARFAFERMDVVVNNDSLMVGAGPVVRRDALAPKQ